MLVTVIQATNFQEAFSQIKSIADKSDAIELRLDFWQTLDYGVIQKIRNSFPLRVIFTLRKASQGGLFKGTEEERLETILKLCELHPDYFDIEYDVPISFCEKLHKDFPKIKLIRSFHDFDKTPEDLAAILQSMQNPCFTVYKMATLANSIIDSLHLLLFLKEHHHIPLSAFCMGDRGEFTRIVGPIFGNKLTYAAVNSQEAVAPGQLSLDELINVYHINHFTSATKIFGLLGHPIEKSPGHILHNQAIRFLKENAVYVKLTLLETELAAAINLLRQLPFYGFSVTIPLKESIIPLVDLAEDPSTSCKAINTICIQDNFWEAFNTDGIGAIQAVEKRLAIKNKTIVIIGAGGAARGIAYYAKHQGAKIIIFNRTLESGETLAEELSGEFYSLNELHRLQQISYDVIINTLPNEVPIQEADFKANTYVMDCVYNPVMTEFLLKAKAASCHVIPGYEMFVNQAVGQVRCWFKPDAEKIKQVEELMTEFFNEKSWLFKFRGNYVCK